MVLADLNPIELAFAKLKAHLRKVAERTMPDLWRRIAQILTAFTPQECAAFLHHDGYTAA
jgi:transposase